MEDVNFSKVRALQPSAKSSSRSANFVSTSKNLLKNRNWTFPVVQHFIWKLEFASNILWMIVACQNHWIPNVSHELSYIWNAYK